VRTEHGLSDRRVWLVAAALLAAHPACDCGGDSTAGPCHSRTDCPPGAECVDGTCILPDGGTDGDADAPEDGREDGGEACPGPVCGAACCAAGQACIAGACCDVADACGGTACCGADEVCEDGACVLDCGEDPPCVDVCCAADEVCHASGCLVPGDPCDDPYDCPADQYCETTIGRCMPRTGIDETCEYRPPPSAFAPEVEWHWTGVSTAPEVRNVLSTPAVGDVDADGFPDVALLAYSTGSPTYLVVLDGRDGSEKLVDPLSPAAGWSTHVALGNLDADPQLEIAISVEPAAIAVFEADGTRRWLTPLGSLTGVSIGAPAIADMDGVPPAEVVWGAVVLSADGVVLEDRGHCGALNYSDGPISVPVDLEGDTVMELVGGNRVLRFGGVVVWDRPTETEGYPAVADFFGDGVPDVVVVSRGTVRVMSALTGEVSFGPLAIPGGGNGGPPTVADFDGDGRPEFAAAALGCYAVYDPDCSGAAPDPTRCDRSAVELNACLPVLVDGVLWSQPNQDDSSSVTGSSVFDFEGDGHAEVVYNDECHLFVYDGGTGRVLLARPNTSRTGSENPIVVDVDGDENAEIVVPANAETRRCDLPVTDVPDTWGMFAFGDPAREWVRTRRVWNQHAYYVTNVDDDGGIPVPVRPNWTVPGLNNFRQNVQPEGLFAAPDLVVARVVVNPRLCSASLELAAWITNRGSGGAPAGIPVAFYEGDPAVGGTLLGVVPTSERILPGASTRVTLAAPVGDARVGETILYFVRVDDDGTGASSGLTHECRSDNNSFGPTPGICPIIG
jgi:hypothetical protein